MTPGEAFKCICTVVIVAASVHAIRDPKYDRLRKGLFAMLAVVAVCYGAFSVLGNPNRAIYNPKYVGFRILSMLVQAGLLFTIIALGVFRPAQKDRMTRRERRKQAISPQRTEPGRVVKPSPRH